MKVCWKERGLLIDRRLSVPLTGTKNCTRTFRWGAGHDVAQIVAAHRPLLVRYVCACCLSYDC